MAEGFIGRIGDKKSEAPGYVLDSIQGTLQAVGLDQKGLPSGIDNLRIDGPFMSYYNGLTMAPNVPYHSIIGNKAAADTPGGTDGVVTYESSHLAGAASEKIVESGHSLMDHPQTILEIRRILPLHLKAGR